MKRAVVLSGGGSKGAYQIGVWKALRKLKIKYDIITGTSVGALNGVLMVQKTYFKALWLWRNIDDKLVYNEVIEEKIKKNKYKLLKKYFASIIKGGLKVDKLSELISETVDEKKFFESTIDYGLIMVSFPSLKEETKTKIQIKANKLKEYLMASAACYPFFPKKEIENKMYVDGGYYDNLPINLAEKLGATEVIAVDLDSPGYKQKTINKKLKVTLIKPKVDLGNFIEFKKNNAKFNIKLGYNDTMKKYKKLMGQKYTFHVAEYESSLGSIKEYIETEKPSTFTKILSLKMVETSLENLAILFKVDISKIYNVNKFLKILSKKIAKEHQKKYKEEKINILDKKTRLFNSYNNIIKKGKISSDLWIKTTSIIKHEEMIEILIIKQLLDGDKD